MIKGIIIEGSDCSGKTTLVRALKSPLSHSGWDVADLGHKNGNQFDRYMDQYVNANKVIFDRGHFSEVVYGDLWRGGHGMNEWERLFLDEYALNNFLVIFAHAPEKMMKERYNSRSYGQIIEEDELAIVQSRFASVLKHPNVLHYDSSSLAALDAIVEKVLSLLDAEGLNKEIVKAQAAPVQNEKKFILLEGANGSGKSTLSKLLKISMVGWSVKTLDYKPESPFERYLKEYSTGSGMIFDRGHFSEIVYGNLFRNGKHFSELELNLLNAYVKNRGIVILCDPALDVLTSRVTTASYAKHIHESSLDLVKEGFKSALEQSQIPYYVVDTSKKENVEEVIAAVTADLSVQSYSEMGWDKPLQG